MQFAFISLFQKHIVSRRFFCCGSLLLVCDVRSGVFFTLCMFKAMYIKYLVDIWTVCSIVYCSSRWVFHIHIRSFGKGLLIRFSLYYVYLYFCYFPFWFRGQDSGSDCTTLRERLCTHKMFTKDQCFYLNNLKFSIKSYVLDVY